MTGQEFKEKLIDGLKVFGIFCMLRLVMINAGLMFVRIPLIDPLLASLRNFLLQKLESLG